MKIFFTFCILLISTSTIFAQKSIKVKYSGVNDTRISIVYNGLVEKEVCFVKTPNDADIKVHITKIRNNENYTVERNGIVDEQILIKNQTSLYDHKFKLTSRNRRAIRIYVSLIPNTELIVSSYSNLNQEEIIATLYREINAFHNKK